MYVYNTRRNHKLIILSTRTINLVCNCYKRIYIHKTKYPECRGGIRTYTLFARSRDRYIMYTNLHQMCTRKRYNFRSFNNVFFFFKTVQVLSRALYTAITMEIKIILYFIGHPWITNRLVNCPRYYEYSADLMVNETSNVVR